MFPFYFIVSMYFFNSWKLLPIKKIQNAIDIDLFHFTIASTTWKKKINVQLQSSLFKNKTEENEICIGNGAVM